MCTKFNFKKAVLFSEMAYIPNVRSEIYGRAEGVIKGVYNSDLVFRKSFGISLIFQILLFNHYNLVFIVHIYVLPSGYIFRIKREKCFQTVLVNNKLMWDSD